MLNILFCRSIIRSDVGNGNPLGEAGYLGVSLIRCAQTEFIKNISKFQSTKYNLKYVLQSDDTFRSLYHKTPSPHHCSQFSH